MSTSELPRLLWTTPADAAAVVVVVAADDDAAMVGVDEGRDERLIAPPETLTSEDPSMQSRFDSS